MGWLFMIWVVCLVLVLWMGIRHVSRDYDDDQRDGR